MHQKTIFTCIFFLLTILVSAQENSIPVYNEYKRAIANGTRSLQGDPGPNYWQNEVSYMLEAEVDPVNSWLKGKGRIVFTNNSPDTLTYIYLRFYQNMYAEGSTRNITIRQGDIHEGVTVHYLMVNGVPVDLSSGDKFRIRNTLGRLRPESTLLPGKSMEIDIAWEFHIPEHTYLRTGRTDSSTYFIGYWYPQVAMYDDINGWDRNSYSGTEEFYNEHADFDVRVNVPVTHGVWATGILQNPEEVFAEESLERYREAQESRTKIGIFREEDLGAGNRQYQAPEGNHVFHFKAGKVPDFAFAIGDHFLWDGARMDLPGNHKVFIQSVYRPEAMDFRKMIPWTRKFINYFSNNLPGVAYPYPAFTVIEAVRDKTDGGMEFPMLANNPTSDTDGRAAGTLSHEIAHTYFPFLTGTSESIHGWMDEGFASMVPREAIMEIDSNRNRVKAHSRLVSMVGGRSDDMPIFTPTNQLGSFLFFPTYVKPNLALFYLQEELGEGLFREALREFIITWQYKHASPYDLFFKFNHMAGKSLDWFWRSWYFERNHPDLAIEYVSEDETDPHARIRLEGGLLIPIELRVRYENGQSEVFRYPVGIWSDGETVKKIRLRTVPLELELGSPEIPDTDTGNNHWKK